MKFKRIAVIYRGHLRTWNYVKNVNFSSFEKISRKVDYYFVTWNLPYDHDAVQNDFKNKNLIKYLKIDVDKKYYNFDIGSRWLGYNIAPFKTQQENDFSYDAVFDLRPDILFLINNKNKLITLEENT